MAIYLKKFESTSQYDSYIQGDGVILPNVSLCEDANSVHYNPKHDYSKDYFTMVVTTGGYIKWSGSTANSGETGNTIYYSKDNGTTWATANTNTTISVAAGDKVLWKGTPTPNSNNGIGKFSGTTNVRYSVEGNVMSLLYGDDFKGQTSLSGKNYALHGLFISNTNVTSAENMSLPATTLTSYCYQNMFLGCTNLTTAPELPATTLAQYCYESMFSGCTSLTTAPNLPATTLENSCYRRMFYNCTGLTTAPSVLPATTLKSYCYSWMFQGCTSLTTAPELPATTLVGDCYYAMFNGCRSLNYIKAMFTTTPSYSYTANWVGGVASSGTFVKNAAATWTSSCSIDTYPCYWTVETASA